MKLLIYYETYKAEKIKIQNVCTHQTPLSIRQSFALKSLMYYYDDLKN